MDLNRLEILVGKNNLKKIENLNILIVGIGGVGGYTLESLVRSGVKNITIVDPDKIDKTNLNRQIITNSENIGKYKVSEAKKRANTINKSANIIDKCLFLDESNINSLVLNSYDYIVDACDTLNTKVLLITLSLKNNIKIISSMGTAKKLDATKLSITSLDKTSYDPLAKRLRKEIDKKLQKKVVVVSSTEKRVETKYLGSTSYVPAIAGLLITNYIINDTIKD